MEKKQKTEREPVVQFCDLCQESIPDREIAEGSSLEVHGRRVCIKCRRRLVPPLPSARIAAFLAFLTLAGIAGAGWFVYRLDRSNRDMDGRLAGMDTYLRKRIDKQDRTLEERTGELARNLRGLTQQVGVAAQNARSASQATGTLEANLQSLKLDQEKRAQITEAGFNRLSQGLDKLQGGDGGQSLARLEELVADLRRLIERLGAARPAPANPGANGPGGAKPQATPKAPASPTLTRLAERLRHREPDERWKAIEALEKVGGPQAVKLVAGALADTDLWVRRLAAEVLGRMGGDGGVGGLIKALGDGEFMVRGAAIASLRKLTGQSFEYNPHDSPAKRRAAVSRWEGWWEKRKAERGKG